MEAYERRVSPDVGANSVSQPGVDGLSLNVTTLSGIQHCIIVDPISTIEQLLAKLEENLTVDELHEVRMFQGTSEVRAFTDIEKHVLVASGSVQAVVTPSADKATRVLAMLNNKIQQPLPSSKAFSKPPPPPLPKPLRYSLTPFVECMYLLQGYDEIPADESSFVDDITLCIRALKVLEALPERIGNMELKDCGDCAVKKLVNTLLSRLRLLAFSDTHPYLALVAYLRIATTVQISPYIRAVVCNRVPHLAWALHGCSAILPDCCIAACFNADLASAIQNLRGNDWLVESTLCVFASMHPCSIIRGEALKAIFAKWDSKYEKEFALISNADPTSLVRETIDASLDSRASLFAEKKQRMPAAGIIVSPLRAPPPAPPRPLNSKILSGRPFGPAVTPIQSATACNAGTAEL